MAFSLNNILLSTSMLELSKVLHRICCCSYVVAHNYVTQNFFVSFGFGLMQILFKHGQLIEINHDVHMHSPPAHAPNPLPDSSDNNPTRGVQVDNATSIGEYVI